MRIIGRVESVWRYPVKSMRGERLEEAFVGFAGIYGDRVYAFHDSGAPAGFPYLTAREQEDMLLYQARFRRPDLMRVPPNLEPASALGPGVTPVYPSAAETGVEVTAPDGSTYDIEDPALIARLSSGLGERHSVRLLRSDRALTDCRPVSLFGIWTARQLSGEVGAEVDLRNFRASIYADFDSQQGFAEDQLLGRTLKIGTQAKVVVVERDGRCKMITLDPDTAEANPDIIRAVARHHEGKAGVYGVVLTEGIVRPGDEIAVMD